MILDALNRQTEMSIRAGIDFLLAGQDRDGFWRDYHLRTGPSEAWTTAWVGWCLTGFSTAPRVRDALRRAIAAIRSTRTPYGWGYNRNTGADADSTAWVVNFLSAAGYRCPELAEQLLLPFISPSGSVRTFLDPTVGTWCDPHLDVASMVGLALLNSGARCEFVSRIRAMLLDAAEIDGTWPSFWWASRTYATVWAGCFLQRTGGLDPRHTGQLVEFLSAESSRQTVMEETLGLLLLQELNAPEIIAARIAINLLEGQQASGGWNPSPMLLVPLRTATDDLKDVGPHGDVRALVSTALACFSLFRWSASTAHVTESRASGSAYDQRWSAATGMANQTPNGPNYG